MRACAAALAAVALAACGAKDESGGRGTTTKGAPDAKAAGSPAARPSARLTDA